MKLINFILGSSDTYMPLIAMVVFLLLKKKIIYRERLIFLYLLVNILVFATTNILALNKITNIFLYHFYALFELIFVTWFFNKVMLKKSLLSFYIISGFYTFYWVLNILFWEPFNVFNSNSAGVANIIILILSMYYMLQLAKSEDILNFQKLPAFWFASAFLTSCAVSVLGVVVYKYYQYNNSEQQLQTGLKIWMLPIAGTIIKFTLIIFGLLCYKRRSSNSISHYLFQ